MGEFRRSNQEGPFGFVTMIGHLITMSLLPHWWNFPETEKIWVSWRLWVIVLLYVVGLYPVFRFFAQKWDNNLKMTVHEAERDVEAHQ